MRRIEEVRENNNDRWIQQSGIWLESVFFKILNGDKLDGWEMQIRNALLANIGPIPESPAVFTARVMKEFQDGRPNDA